MTLAQLNRKFSTQYACKRFLTDKRWPEGVHCPRCNNAEVYERKTRPFHWVCKAKTCGGRNGYRFSVITKTVFDATKCPLTTWFQAILLMTRNKEGFTASQIQRRIDTDDYRTVWYMCNRIRAAIGDYDLLKLRDEVKADERAKQAQKMQDIRDRVKTYVRSW